MLSGIVVDLKRKEKIPLLYDHHNHPSQYASFLESVHLSDIKDKDRAKKKIKKNTTEKDLNIVLGWNDSYYSFSDSELEDFPPLVICNLSLHGFLYNEKALRILEKCYGNSHLIKKTSNLSWMEKNLPEVNRLLVEIIGLDSERLESMYEILSRKGIWKVEDMHLHNKDFMNVYEKTDLEERTDFWTSKEIFERMNDEEKEKIEGIKIFTDGALGPKTAAIKPEYPNGENGVLLYDKPQLKNHIKNIEKEKISIHSIGDRAIEQVFLSLEELEKENYSLPSIRVEHAQFIDKSMAEKAKSLDVILSMQPNFSLDSIHYKDRLPGRYLKKNNPFRMLIDEVGFEPGTDLIFGSDGMPHGVEAALEASLFPLYDNQRLRLDEFVDGYCVEDRSLGVIELIIDDDKEKCKIEKIVS